jgi:hypothetical protein
VSPSGEQLEILAIRDELASVAAFEAALKERLDALATFRTKSFAHIRGLLRHADKSPALAVAAEWSGGTRLSQILSIADDQLLGIDIRVALDITRQLVHAVAVLHHNLPGISHGAIGPERIAVTRDARVVVLEYGFGAALATLGYSQDKYWKELSIPLPNPADPPRFDQRTDMMQIGAVALALLAGRPLGKEEYPDKLRALADRLWAVTPAGAIEPLPFTIRTWLTRALQMDDTRSFPSAVEAWTELDRALGGNTYVKPHMSFHAMLAEYERHTGTVLERPAPAVELSTSASATPIAPAPMAAAPIAATPAPAPISGMPLSPASPTEPAAEPIHTQPVLPESMVASAPSTDTPPLTSTPVELLDAGASRDRSPEPLPTTPLPTTPFTTTPFATTVHATARSEEDEAEGEGQVDGMRKTFAWRPRWRVAAAAIVVVAGMGFAISGRSFMTAPAEAEASGTLVVQTSPAGVAVVVDGQARGATPLTLALAPGSHILELLADGNVRTIPLTLTAGGTVSQFIELAGPAATTGALQVQSEPSGARVTVDGKPEGVAPLTVEALAPGLHSVTVSNDLGSVTKAVTINPGATASLVVPMSAPRGAPLSGWISLAAPADLQVYENDSLLGSNRSDRIMVSVGRHELTIVNDALGFRANRVVNVQPGQVSPIRLEWPKGTMAINALPWAEVFVDGERVGETPIGSLSVPIGNHDILFRHPELGERLLRTTVTLDSPARLSVDLRK